MTRSELSEKVESFLANGGTITRCPGFGDGVPLPDASVIQFQKRVMRRNQTIQRGRQKKLQRLGLTIDG